MRNVRTSKSIPCADSLRNYKVSTVLDFLCQNLTTTLEDEDGSKEKGTWSFLRMLNDCITQLIFPVTASKKLTLKKG